MDTHVDPSLYTSVRHPRAKWVYTQSENEYRLVCALILGDAFVAAGIHSLAAYVDR